MLATATGIMSLLLQQAEAHLYSLLAVCTPRLCTDRSGHQAVSQQPRIDSSPSEDRTTEQGLLVLAPPQMLSQALFSFQEGLQAAPAHADPSSLAGQGTIGLSCQASLSPASSLASNGAHPPVPFPCSVHIKGCNA